MGASLQYASRNTQKHASMFLASGTLVFMSNRTVNLHCKVQPACFIKGVGHRRFAGLEGYDVLGPRAKAALKNMRFA